MAFEGKRVLKIALSIFLLFLALSLFIIYLRYLDLKKAFIEKASQKVSSAIQQKVHIQDLSISPSGSINLYNMTINNPEGFASGQLLRIRKIHLGLRLSEFLKGNYSFRYIALYSPELTLTKNEQNRWNISDGLMGLLSGNSSTTKYQVDEFSIESGFFAVNKDERIQSTSINLRLKNLSSEPATKTEISGTILYAKNRIQVNGWTYLNDTAKKTSLSISSKDFKLSPFKKNLDTYKIETEKTRISIDLKMEGDTEKGFHITPNVQVSRIGLSLTKKSFGDIRLQADAALNLRDRSLVVNAASLSVNGFSTMTFKGAVTDLKNPSYRGDIKIDRLDLSGFNFMKDLKVKGILSSDNLRIKGKFEPKVPEVSGSLRVKEGGIESHNALIEKIDAELIFLLNKEMSIKGEGLLRVVKAGQYSLLKPTDVRLSATIRGSRERMGIHSLLSLSSLEIKYKDGKNLSLDSGNVMIEGAIKDDDFSGKNSFELKGIKFADRSIPWLKSKSDMDYQKGEMFIRNLMIETEDLTSSANDIRVILPKTEAVYKAEIWNMNAAYRTNRVLLKEGDFHLTLSLGKETASGDLRFSAKNILSYGIIFSQISGIGEFNDKHFSLDIGGAEVAGGRIKAAVRGNTTEGLLPLRTTFLAEGIDLSAALKLAPKSMELPYSLAGEVKRASFDGTVDDQESLKGYGSVDARKVTVLNPTTSRNLVKDASLKADIEFMGRDLSFKGEAAAGNLPTLFSGMAKGFLEKERHFQVKGSLAEVSISDIRNTFWDIFPDSLLYVGMQGSVSSNVSVDYGRNGLNIGGNLLLRDFILEGENGEYSVGPINGTVPIKYGKDQNEKEGMNLPSFEKPRFDHLRDYYAKQTLKEDLHTLTIGSLRYGFPLLENINLFVEQKGNIWTIERFSANIFGGKLDGSAILDLSNGFLCRGGFLVRGLSLRKLCDGMEPIKGFISGKVDGIAGFKTSGPGISQLIGMADFWTYSTEDEKTMISKEFLQKVGGPSMKASLRNRNFNKGVFSLYLKDENLIFKDLEISNRNFLGITDLSVKVAPLGNRIALDHLLGTIAEAAERAKEKK